MVSKASMILAFALLAIFATSTCLGVGPKTQDVQAQGLEGLQDGSMLNNRALLGEKKLPAEALGVATVGLREEFMLSIRALLGLRNQDKAAKKKAREVAKYNRRIDRANKKLKRKQEKADKKKDKHVGRKKQGQKKQGEDKG